MKLKSALLITLGLLLVGVAACGQAATPTSTPTTAPTDTSTVAPTQAPTDTATAAPTATQVPITRPSNAGGAGQAISLAGKAAAGAKIFTANCVICHAADGKGSVANPGSDDGTVPALNPIDPTIKDASFLTFAYNVDIFLEHGSTPSGKSPTFKMPAWGDQNSSLRSKSPT